MGLKHVLDTNVVLYWLARRLAESPPRMADVCISVITEMELLSFPFPDPEQESGMRAFLRTIQIIPLTDEVKRRAIEIRRGRLLKLPDAIIAATGLVLSAELWSNDARFQKIAGLQLRPLRLTEP
jgi:predicted nucleic acid-binding protein